MAYVLVGHYRVVYAKDDVALTQSGFGGGHALIRLVHYHALQFLVVSYERPHTGIFSCKHHLEVFGVFLGIVFGVGVEAA